MKHLYKFILYIWFIAISTFTVQAQNSDQKFFEAIGSPSNPKVQASWNRYYTYAGVTDLCKKLAEAHPDLIKLSSIGKSFKGVDIWILTVSDHKAGNPDRKPAFYIDGNIHSNEIQGTEFSLYTAWYLAEMYGKSDFITNLLKEKTFYIVPTINPDARDDYMMGKNTAHSPRSGMMAFDDDQDGLEDEDGFDDVNGDGHITLMRRKTANGNYRLDPNDPRMMVRVGPDEFGTYELLGYEGLDNDGDGLINEDRVGGYYDPNRDWAWNWQPDYVQFGALKYPFSVPENRAVSEFVMAHPNIAGAQSYHNSGGMILRGPGGKEDEGSYDRNDKRVYDALGEKGEKLIPGYKYMVIYKDLYSAYGGEVDWFSGGRGIFSFTNELFTPYLFFNQKSDRNYYTGSKDQFLFDRYLLFKDGFVEWKPFNHPQYGEIEIGGFKKNYSRANPGFLLESDAHRNMAFTIYHAYHTPKLVIEDVEEKDLGGGLMQITATISNQRMIPTHSSQDIRYKIERPDYVKINGVEVIAGMVVTNKDMNVSQEQPYTPEQIELKNIPGMGQAHVRWIVKGKGKYSISVDSMKGGLANWQK